jgi:hypothetical protein
VHTIRKGKNRKPSFRLPHFLTPHRKYEEEPEKPEPVVLELKYPILPQLSIYFHRIKMFSIKPGSDCACSMAAIGRGTFCSSGEVQKSRALADPFSHDRKNHENF